MVPRSKAIAALSILLLFGPLASTQALAQAPPPPVPYTVQSDAQITVRADRSASGLSTRRFKVLAPAGIGPVSQQKVLYIEGLQSIDIVEAYTEKADGRRITVDPANIITSDAATGLQAVFAHDLKQRTLLFPDVQVGDTVVLTQRIDTVHGLFPGQFIDAEVFPRSQPIAAARVVIEAPRDLDLHIGAIGPGFSERIEDVGDTRRDTVTLTPQPYAPAEAGAVSPIDHDSAILMSTFKSYEEMGRAYAAAAVAKTKVTPEIAALADEITKGVRDRRQQAAAIDTWMKRNIRYVAVYLGLGRVVPNDATAVLRNKFGDCKDKVTLMSALLAAKGIASEPVLINLGPAYTLPQPPTLVALNHVILYLPDFDLYDDPTVSMASFGVLAAEAYDKPVVRISSEGAEMARTPAMKADDHVTHATSHIKVAADGTMSGETEMSNSGLFATELRAVATLTQTGGDEAFVRTRLQSLGTPGTGRIDPSHLTDLHSSDLNDPAKAKASFTLSERFKPPQPGQGVAIPVGSPLSARPGDFLLPAPFTGRKFAFRCYAGREIEDIDVSFDPAWPMLPAVVPPLAVDNPYFSYRADSSIEGRTLRIHREFTSHVAHQSCAPEVDTEIANDIRAVAVNLRTAYSFDRAPRATSGSAAPPTSQTVDIRRTAVTGHKLPLDFLSSINPDCTSIGFATVRITEPPKHGKVKVENGTGFPNYPPNNPRSECNKKRVDGVTVTYEPDAGFTGADSINAEAIFASGGLSKRRYAIDVK